MFLNHAERAPHDGNQFYWAAHGYKGVFTEYVRAELQASASDEVCIVLRESNGRVVHISSLKGEPFAVAFSFTSTILLVRR
jgi:hypothetical protein